MEIEPLFVPTCPMVGQRDPDPMLEATGTRQGISWTMVANNPCQGGTL